MEINLENVKGIFSLIGQVDRYSALLYFSFLLPLFYVLLCKLLGLDEPSTEENDTYPAETPSLGKQIVSIPVDITKSVLDFLVLKNAPGRKIIFVISMSSFFIGLVIFIWHASTISRRQLAGLQVRNAMVQGNYTFYDLQKLKKLYVGTEMVDPKDLEESFPNDFTITRENDNRSFIYLASDSLRIRSLSFAVNILDSYLDYNLSPGEYVSFDELDSICGDYFNYDCSYELIARKPFKYSYFLLSSGTPAIRLNMKEAQISKSSDNAPHIDDIPAQSTTIVTTPSGRKRKLTHPSLKTDDPDSEESSLSEEIKYALASTTSEPVIFSKSKNGPCDADGCPNHCNFDGKKRKEAKTSVSKGKKITYATVTDFLGKFADKHPDASMPTIIGKSAGRVPVEDFNVTITKCWLFCFAKESDEDYHLVVGTKKDLKDPSNRFMIVEISGLPENSGFDRTSLNKAQSSFFKIVGEPVCNSGYYWFDNGNDPVPITVSGSIYWDIEHWSSKNQSIGAHGPSELRKQLTTVWEIHPVTNIQEVQ